MSGIKDIYKTALIARPQDMALFMGTQAAWRWWLSWLSLFVVRYACSGILLSLFITIYSVCLHLSDWTGDQSLLLIEVGYAFGISDCFLWGLGVWCFKLTHDFLICRIHFDPLLLDPLHFSPYSLEREIFKHLLSVLLIILSFNFQIDSRWLVLLDWVKGLICLRVRLCAWFINFDITDVCKRRVRNSLTLLLDYLWA